MTPLQDAATVAGIIMALTGLIAVFPTIWRFLCLPGRIEQRLEKLDQLDGIGDAAVAAQNASNRAADVAEMAAQIAAEAHDEWKGATKVVTHEMARVSAKVDAHERRINDLDSRVRKIEDDRP